MLDKCPHLPSPTATLTGFGDPLTGECVLQIWQKWAGSNHKLLLSEFKFVHNSWIFVLILLRSQTWLKRPLKAAEIMQDYLVSFWPPDPALLLLVASPSCLIGNTKPGCSSVQKSRKQARDSRRERASTSEGARRDKWKKKSKGKIISFTKRKIATSFTDRCYSSFSAFLKTFSLLPLNERKSAGYQ